LCIEKGIALCVIDTSSLKYWKPANAQRYLDIVIEVLERHASSTKSMVDAAGVEPASHA